MVGANFSAAPNPRHFVAAQPQIAAGTAYDLRNHIPEYLLSQELTATNAYTGGKHISLGFESDSSLQLYMSSQFLSNFFIIVDPVFAKLVGFPEQIYSGLNNGSIQ